MLERIRYLKKELSRSYIHHRLEFAHQPTHALTWMRLRVMPLVRLIEKQPFLRTKQPLNIAAA